MKTDSSIQAIFEVNQKTKVICPLFTSGVSAGFPSPAEDHIDQRLDLNNLLIQHPAATFFVRVSGESMKEAGINHGDILVVDRSLEATSGRIVIAIVNGELTVKRFIQDSVSCQLVAANPDYPPVAITDETDFRVWGVVTSVIHQF
jgi:DNA polymerase V